MSSLLPSDATRPWRASSSASATGSSRSRWQRWDDWSPPPESAPARATVEETWEAPAAEPEVSIAVDWTNISRQPFRRAFLDVSAPVDPQVAEDLRASLCIKIESDPAGNGFTPSPIQNFADLQVFPWWITEALAENKWDAPMPIQSQALPILLSGRNMIGIAQTGSGKTGAFLIPAIIHSNDQRRLTRSDPGPIVLVLAPTRELAVQISDEAEKLCKHSDWSREHRGGIRSVCFYGGGRKGDQLRKFTYEGAHICVATPGRLMDFCKEGKVVLRRVTYLILDEADRMLDMGFSGDMEQIGAAIRPERQTVFFSATWPKEVQSLAYKLCVETPVTIRVGRSGDANGQDEQALLAREGITQEVIVVDYPEEKTPWMKQDEVKQELLHQHIRSNMADPESKMLIFVNEKLFADELCEKMWNEGLQVETLHGGKRQDSRLWTLDNFRKGDTRLLIATDVIGRGLDIPKVSHVVVYTIGGVEDYIHRIGRTARGKDGKGHALLFFEHYDKAPDTARELIAVLEKSKQEVPPKLRQIAEDVASGKRGNAHSWGSSSWSRGGGSGGGWGNGDSWKNGGGNDWKGRGSDWKKGRWKENGPPNTIDAPMGDFLPPQPAPPGSPSE